MGVWEFAVIAVVFYGSAVAIRQVVGRWQAGQPVLVVEPRPPASWGLLDLCAVLALLFFLVQPLVLTLVQRVFRVDFAAGLENLSAEEGALLMSADGIVKLITVGLSIVLIGVRDRSIGRRLGLSPRTLRRDLKIGFVAFLVLAGPTYLLQMLLTTMFPSEHPLTTLFEREPTAWLFAVLAFVAMVSAPISEEYFFRMLLQGWMENAPQAAGDGNRLIWGLRGTSPEHRSDTTAGLKAGISAVPTKLDSTGQSADDPSARDDLSNPYRPPQATNYPHEVSDHDQLATAVEDGPKPVDVPHWPVFVSAAIFALMHFGHGPDPIPLFFLAVGLGYVYRATHRLLPCIIVHLLLNGCSMLLLLLGTLS